MPKSEGRATHVYPIPVFLADILGVILVAPARAVLRVLFDFFRVRLVTDAWREAIEAGRKG